MSTLPTSEISSDTITPPVSAERAIYHQRAFQFLWSGWTLTALAIQFYAVALIWLVLKLTGSGLELSTVLVAAAIPRALAMLVSGTIIDRVQPRWALISAAIASSLLIGGIAVLILMDWLSFGLLLVIAGVQGLADAFFYPASMAQLARIVPKGQLTSANALFQTSDSLANILGPALGGVMIGWIGLTAAFGLNTLCFVIGGLLLAQIRSAPGQEAAPTAIEPFERALLNGLRYAWNHTAIRASLFMVALLNFAAIGPSIVGGALLVEQRFGGDASMFGLLLAGYGGGALLGGLASGWLPPQKRPGLLLAGFSILMGLSMMLLGVVPSFWPAFAIQSLMGIGAGVVGVVAISWLQSRTEPQMQGRMASLLLFSAVALDPFSNALAGVLSDISLALLFAASGGLLLLVRMP